MQHSIAPSPHLIAAEPIYNYYKHLQDNRVQLQQPQQQRQHHQQQVLYRQPPGALNYDRLSGGYTIPAPQPTQPTAAFVQQHPAHLIATPSAAAYHHQPHALLSSPTPSTAAYVHHQQQHQPQQQYVQNVQIDTYNTAPHLLRPNSILQQAAGHIVFPTAPTPYRDIHVQPTPFAINHRLSPKNTNIVSSPATLVATGGVGGNHHEVNYNYRDYDYGQQQQHQQQVAYQRQRQQEPALFFVASEATKVHDPRGGTGAAGVLLQPNQALYYKQSR